MRKAKITGSNVVKHQMLVHSPHSDIEIPTTVLTLEEKTIVRKTQKSSSSDLNAGKILQYFYMACSNRKGAASLSRAEKSIKGSQELWLLLISLFIKTICLCIIIIIINSHSQAIIQDK
ncbi:hypothetical protein STEG23_008470, partial [Scotinomys teguina]